MEEREYWKVITEQGAHTTFAPSARKAERNARYRLVMDGRPYSTPRPEDWEAMRNVRVLRVLRVEG